ncbi:uncharacterized protein TRAVEDRAFT_93848, partial [Trametes versicolor FP-101664 SS1]
SMESLALALPRAGIEEPFEVEPPRIPTECEPTPILWRGGTPPYTVTIISSRPPPVTVFPDVDGIDFIWTADVPATFSVSFKVEDSTGVFVQTSDVTVRRGLDESCLSSATASESQPSDSSTLASTSSPPPTAPPSPPISSASPETSTTS